MRGRAAAGTVALIGCAAAAAALAQGPSGFEFDPVPRWADEPETEAVCAAIAKECTAQLKDGEIEADWGYAELYDPEGFLVGLRSTASTGCKPLDEHLLLGQRRFRKVFAAEGKPDLDDVTVELAPGTPKSAVRLVKRGTTSVSMGC
jgi:hypothetical protein